jgi:hypothetical protein
LAESGYMNPSQFNRVWPWEAGRPAARPRQLGRGKKSGEKKEIRRSWPTNCSGLVGPCQSQAEAGAAASRHTR